MTSLATGEWVRPRGGLDVAAAGLTSSPRAIAYLGMSVTAQKEGFRPLLHARLSAMFGVEHTAVNAGIGGVGSVACAFLADDLVVARKPALCFLECATGDFDKSYRADIGPAVEGIVRKLLASGCQVCMVHLPRLGTGASWSAEVIGEHERVAAHYGVPSVNVARSIENDLASGTAAAEDLYRDVVHTTPAGARRVAELIATGVAGICSTPVACADRFPTALHPDHFEFTRIAYAARLAPASCVRASFRGWHRLVDFDPGATFVFEAANGELKGLLVVVGPTSGEVIVSATGSPTTYQLHDRWCSYERLSAVVFERAILRGTAATITACARLKLIGFLVREDAAMPPAFEAGDRLGEARA
jgi:hypothetical protein